MAAILPISHVPLPSSIRPTGAAPGGGGFQDIFASAIREVEGAGKNASNTVERFLSGEGEDVHTTVLATQRAELSFELFVQARNKVVSAYQEIMRMQM